MWRTTHPVAPESSLAPWQRVTSEAVHWLLYLLVLATTITGWLFASFRGWSISLLFMIPLPMLSADNPAAGKTIDGWHQAMEWSLLVVIGVHVAAALTAAFASPPPNVADSTGDWKKRSKPGGLRRSSRKRARMGARHFHRVARV